MNYTEIFYVFYSDDLHAQVSKAYDSESIYSESSATVCRSRYSNYYSFLCHSTCLHITPKIIGDELIRTFDKVNSNPTYQLEKDADDKISLVVNITKGKRRVSVVVLF